MSVTCTKDFEIHIDTYACGDPAVALVAGTPGYPPGGDASCGGGAARWLPWTLGGSLCLDTWDFFGVSKIPMAWLFGTGIISVSFCMAVKTPTIEVHALLSRDLAETITFGIKDENGVDVWGPFVQGPPNPNPPGTYLMAGLTASVLLGDLTGNMRTYTLSVNGTYSTFPFYSVISFAP